MRKVFVAAAVMGMATAAFGQYIEVGDAPDGPLSAQLVAGAGGLATITGATSGAAGDRRDAFDILIKDPDLFYATTAAPVDPAGTASFDTRLWLFDTSGNVIMGNDDGPGGSPFRATISDPADWNALTGGILGADPVPAFGPGVYRLVIAGFSDDPDDGAGTDMARLGVDFDALWGPNPAAGAFDHWESTTGATGTYTIALRGTSFVPEPASLALLALGGLAALRRR
jgi:hypothetical protein